MNQFYSRKVYLVKEDETVEFKFGKQMQCDGAKEIYLVTDSGPDAGLVAQDTTKYEIFQYDYDNANDFFPSFFIHRVRVVQDTASALPDYLDKTTKDRGNGNVYFYPDGSIEVGYNFQPQQYNKFGSQLVKRQGALRDPKSYLEG
jgi:hypothetical protein